ncbi:MAG: HAD family hydrolase [Promethearchaeota archaeon]
MVNGIIFDFDGVVVNPAMCPNLYQMLSRRCGVSWDKINRYTLQFWLKARVKAIDDEQYWKSLATICRISKEEIQRIAYSFFQPNADVLRIIKALRKKYNVGILSNHLEHWFNHILNFYGLAHNFDFIFTSFTEKIAKPDINLYKTVLQKLKILPEQCVFIDDREPNLKTARRLGMITIIFYSATQLEEELNAILEV